jgi:hypothetical protein
MRVYPITLEEVQFRNPSRVWDQTCAACGRPIPADDEVWVCDDSDLQPPKALVCNVIHLCATCAQDEPAIRQELRAIATTYDTEDPAHAETLRRMAESPLVRMQE